MKKALSLILVLVMLVGMMPMTAFATEKDHGRLSLEGLNVLCLGDSITAGQGLTTDTRWTNVLASKYGWNLTNKSQGGISLSSYYYTANGKTDVSIAKKAEILKTMTTKPDVIIVWGGHNDTSYRYSPMGTWEDETTDSFKGALKHIAELAAEYAPDATLFVLTPLWTTEAPSTLKVPENTTDNNWMFVDAIYEGADIYGWIPVNMDLCGITPFTKSGLLLDNIHPNEVGTEKIVEYLSKELASYGEGGKKETIIFNKSDVSLNLGESTAVKGVLSPRSGTGTTELTWSSSNPSVATVEAGGKITAAAPGTATVTATATNGTSANITVSVACEHTYEGGVCTSCGAAQPGPVITQQPVDSEAAMGETFCVTVEAEGEGLKYQWYFRNAGTTAWHKSGVRDNTYDDVMTTARAGREVYCVITDANGNSITTDTVKLICVPSEKLEIITQPADGEAILGERYCVTVEAKGEGLKYQWYFRNKGATRWTKSSVTDNTYDDIMTNTRNGREVYCVITDLAGNKVTTNIVKLVRVPMKLEITSQPTDATAAFGETFCATVEAKGEGLKYQWYYRNAGSSVWHKSGVRDNTYDDVMTKARNGREIYCVITDMWGNSVTTDTVKLIAVPKVELKIVSQTYQSAAMGERFCVTVNAQGDGLTYQWYFRNAGSSMWYKSSVRDNTYDDVMTKARANREVYCVITDAFGNQVTTEVVTLVLDN